MPAKWKAHGVEVRRDRFFLKKLLKQYGAWLKHEYRSTFCVIN